MGGFIALAALRGMGLALSNARLRRQQKRSGFTPETFEALVEPRALSLAFWAMSVFLVFAAAATLPLVIRANQVLWLATGAIVLTNTVALAATPP